jgi:hypothetical protein
MDCFILRVRNDVRDNLNCTLFICPFFYFVRALKGCVRARQITYRTLCAACFALVVLMTVFPDDSALPGRDAAMFRQLLNGRPDAEQAQT